MNSSMEALHPSDATIKTLWGLIIALFFIGSIVGSFFIRLTAEKVGSRPASSRGFVNMMSGTILQLGTVFGSIIAMPEVFGSSNRWWLIYAFEMLPIFISIVWMIFVYESPIQYLHKDDQENAKKSIIFYYGKFAAVNSLDEILLELNQQKSKAQQNKANFLAIFKSRENLRGCLVGCIVATTVGFSGVTIIGVYCVEILTTSGLTHLQSSIATTLIMIASVVSRASSEGFRRGFLDCCTFFLSFSGYIWKALFDASLQCFKMSEMRPAIIKLHEKGYSVRKIEEMLDVPRSTVQDHIKRFEETRSNKDRKGRGRKRTARSKKNVQRAKGMLKRNKTTKANSSRKLAKKLSVSQTSAMEILREDLGMKSWKMQKCQKLNEEAKKIRRERCPALLRRFDRGSHRRIVFSDEKLFDIQQCFNHQNDRIWSEGKPDTEERAIERTQKAESVMVWAAISARGKTPLVFVDQKTKIDRHVYMDMLNDHLFPWT
uniref:Uncharacterized protein n=1 Tax=Acrobeloides nanus TaxID=290746 RepID=A0A914DIX4_9BILA